MCSNVVFFVMLVSLGGVAWSQSIHFNLTTGDCGDNSTVVTQCNNLYSIAVTSASRSNNYTLHLDCILMTETIACIETALCHCNFSSDHFQLQSGYHINMILFHYYNNLTHCSNSSYWETIQAEVLGPIDNMEGVNCSQYNRTAGDLALSLAVSQIPAVQEVEEICGGMEACYFAYDRGLEEALYNKDWPQYCRESEELLECLVNVSCLCGQSAHSLVVNLVNTERTIYRDNCNTITELPSIPEITITCPGADLCESDDPLYNCLLEFEVAGKLSQTVQHYCTAIFNLANCTEELACDCGFYQEPGYYRSLAVSKHNYVNTYSCESLAGSFPNHTGLNCGIDNRFTEAEKILSISLAEPAFVSQEEARCPGIRQCYEIANAKSSMAHRMKDLTGICQTDAERISCVEQAYCDCGLLDEQDTYNRLYQERLNFGNLCYSVTEFPPLTRCRGLSTCRQSDPMSVCRSEFTFDNSVAGDSFELTCRASKNYITCTEQVGCACGLLDDGTSLEAEVVHNISTMSIKIYDEAGCPDYTGGIYPEEEGIQCAEAPDDGTSRRLVLSYADSSEVAALSSECEGIKNCFESHDKDKAKALTGRNYHQLCQAQETLIYCVDGAYCQCGMNGTTTTENYVMTLVHSYDALCSTIFTIERKPCKKATETGSSERHTLSVVLLLMTLLTSAALMMS